MFDLRRDGHENFINNISFKWIYVKIIISTEPVLNIAWCSVIRLS